MRCCSSGEKLSCESIETRCALGHLVAALVYYGIGMVGIHHAGHSSLTFVYLVEAYLGIVGSDASNTEEACALGWFGIVRQTDGGPAALVYWASEDREETEHEIGGIPFAVSIVAHSCVNSVRFPRIVYGASLG